MPSGKICNALLYCGKVSGRAADKVAKSQVAFVVSLNQFLATGDHFYHICDIKRILADESKEALFAWNGYSKIAAAAVK